MARLIVVGHARHGKDTVCEFLKREGFTFQSSSMFACETFIFEKFSKLYGYKSQEECFEDRVSKRKEWFDAIVEFNNPLYKLGELIFDYYHVYAGLRNAKELEAIRHKGLVDCVIWVDRSEHLPPEPESSMTITQDMCDYTIDNNGTLEELEANVLAFVEDEFIYNINGELEYVG